MGDREFTEFDATVSKTNEILNELEEELGWQNRRSQTYAAMREVLHALRDRLQPQEAVQFASQLPMLMAGMFINGWKMTNKPDKMDADAFYKRIQERFQYSTGGGIPDVVRAVWHVLQKNVSAGALEDIKANLPNDLVKSIESRSRPLPSM
jgi:uncharacterized protein (DUF2267 family)